MVSFGLSFWSVIDQYWNLPDANLRMWVLVNFGIYLLEFVILVGIRIAVTIDSLPKIRNFENIFNLLTGIFGVYGLIMIYKDPIESFKDLNYNNAKLVMILKCMAWFRIIYLIIFACFLVCVGFMVFGVCIITVCKGGDVKQSIQNQVGRRSSIMIAQRVPFMNNLVMNN